MQTTIKRDSSGRPTEGGLRLPGRDRSDEPDQPAKPIIVKTGLRQTSEGRITKPSNPVKNRKRHGNANLSKVLASKGGGLEGLNSKKPNGGSLHNISFPDQSLARGPILDAPKTHVSEPSIEPNSSISSGFSAGDPSQNRISKEIYQNKTHDDVQSDADAATPIIQSPRTPDAVPYGITDEHSHSTDALLPGISDDKHVALYSILGNGESQASHHSESAPPETGGIPSTGPAAPVGL